MVRSVFAIFCLVASLLQSGAAATSWLADGEDVTAPPGYLQLCSRSPEACSRAADDQDFALVSAATLSQLEKFNQKVNISIRYVPDWAQFGRADEWYIATFAGNCEDISLAKRSALIQAGWPAAALWLAIAIVPGGQSHVVLVLRSDWGDIVLDNRTGSLKLWHQADLQFLARQVPGDPTHWRRLRPNP